MIGDGVTELAVGAPYANSYSGSMYILHMYRNGTIKNKIPFELSQTSLAALNVNLELGDLFGRSVASVGDIHGTGVSAIIVGAPNDKSNGFGKGAIYLILFAKE